MTETMTDPTGAGEEKKSSRKVLWIVLGVVLFCCVCGGLVAGGYWVWNNGDRLLQGVGAIVSVARLV